MRPHIICFACNVVLIKINMATRPSQHRRASSGDVNLKLDQIEDRVKDIPPAGKKKPPPPPPPRRQRNSLENSSKSDGVEDVLGGVMNFASSARQSVMGSYIKGTAKSVQSKSSHSQCSQASDDGSISINDVFLSQPQDTSVTSISQSGSTMTEGLSVMEKLKLASNLNASSENMLLKELLETSIRDLEKERRKKRSHRKEPRSLPSHHHSRKVKKKESRRSLSKSVQSDLGPSIKSSSRRRRSIEGNEDSFGSGMTVPMTAVPKQVHAVFARICGGEPLPREDVVSTVVRTLITRSLVMKEDDTSGCCVALIPSDSQCTEGIGKTTIAALVCSRPDVKTHYHRGIAWVDMKKGGGDYEQYTAALPAILTQCGISPHHLKLKPFICTPCEDGPTGKSIAVLLSCYCLTKI